MVNAIPTAKYTHAACTHTYTCLPLKQHNRPVQSVKSQKSSSGSSSPAGSFTPALQRLLRLHCCLGHASPIRAERSVGLLLPSSLYAPPTVSSVVFPKIRSHSALSAFACSKVSAARAAEESPACREGGGWSLSAAGGGGGRGEGRTRFKFTNTGVGMTVSCPLRVIRSGGKKGLRCHQLFLVFMVE